MFSSLTLQIKKTFLTRTRTEMAFNIFHRSSRNFLIYNEKRASLFLIRCYKTYPACRLRVIIYILDYIKKIIRVLISNYYLIQNLLQWLEKNKLDCLFRYKPFHICVYFFNLATNRSGIEGYPTWVGSSLTRKYLIRLTQEKHSSLFCHTISYEIFFIYQDWAQPASLSSLI